MLGGPKFFLLFLIRVLEHAWERGKNISFCVWSDFERSWAEVFVSTLVRMNSELPKSAQFRLHVYT